jgi:hypothetical protein
MKLAQHIACAILTITLGLISHNSIATEKTRSLYSAPLFLFTNAYIDCSIVNTSNIQRSVKTEIFHSVSELTGEVELIEYDEIVLPPGTARSVGAGCLDNCGWVYCKFTVQGGKRAYRASACLGSPEVGISTCITAE